MQQYLQI